MIVRENINFERGLDPKKSMDIGTETAERLKIDSIKWAFDWKKPFRQDFQVINFIEDYYGYPILLLMSTEPNNNRPFIATTTFDYTNNYIVRHSAYKAIEKMIETHVYYDGGVEESLNFERGQSTEEIKRIFGREFKPGDILLRPDNGYSPHRTIMMFKRRTPPDYAGHEYYEVATLGYIDTEGKTGYYGHRFELDNFNTGNHIDVNTKGIRFPNPEEVLILKRFLNPSKISKIKARIGIYPVLNGKTFTLDGKTVIIKESINFERGADPKKAAGVGLTAKRRFKNINEFTDYIIAALPLIFGGKIPEDILSKQEAGMLPESYFAKITKFLYDCDHEMSNGNNDWDGSVDLCPSGFHYWVTPIVQRLEQILGEKRWSEY